MAINPLAPASTSLQQPAQEIGHWQCSDCSHRFYTGHEDHGSACSLYEGGRVAVSYCAGPITQIVSGRLPINCATNNG